MLELEGVRHHRGDWRLAVDHLRIPPASLVGVVGDNGAGKSTLLRVLALLLPLDSGEVRYRGAPVRDRGAVRAMQREVVLVHQHPYLFDAEVIDNVLFGLRMRGLRGGEAQDRAEAALDRLGVAGLAGRRARTLSGGEAQRVAIARALVLEPQILLLDEPLSAVDPASAVRIVTLLQRRDWREEATAVVTTHSAARSPLSFGESHVLVSGRLQ